MKKYIKVTNENIHLIEYRIRQFIERLGCISMQAKYPVSIHLRRLFPNEKRIICQSMLSYLSKNDFLIQVDYSAEKQQKYIRINYQESACGFLIRVGEKIRFAGNNIYRKTNRTFFDKSPVFEVWKIANESDCKEQTHWNKIYSEDYYASVEEEYSRDENAKALFQNFMSEQN